MTKSIQKDAKVDGQGSGDEAEEGEEYEEGEESEESGEQSGEEAPQQEAPGAIPGSPSYSMGSQLGGQSGYSEPVREKALSHSGKPASNQPPSSGHGKSQLPGPQMPGALELGPPGSAGGLSEHHAKSDYLPAVNNIEKPAKGKVKRNMLPPGIEGRENQSQLTVLGNRNDQPLATLGSVAETGPTGPAHMRASMGHAAETMHASSRAPTVNAIQQPPADGIVVEARDLQADPSGDEEHSAERSPLGKSATGVRQSGTASRLASRAASRISQPVPQTASMEQRSAAEGSRRTQPAAVPSDHRSHKTKKSSVVGPPGSAGRPPSDKLGPPPALPDAEDKTSLKSASSFSASRGSARPQPRDVRLGKLQLGTPLPSDKSRK